MPCAYPDKRVISENQALKRTKGFRITFLKPLFIMTSHPGKQLASCGCQIRLPSVVGPIIQHNHVVKYRNYS